LLILGIETATLQVGCAIGGHEGVLASFCAARGRRHAETLTPAIDFVCRQARVSFDEIGAVAVDIGPGLFTGLRVGVVTAKALAQALRVPMIGVASLDLLAFPLRHSSKLIVPVIDARRGELFYAFYRQVPGGAQRLSPYQLGTPADLASELQATGADCLLLGDGALRYPEVFDDVARTAVGSLSLFMSELALRSTRAYYVARVEGMVVGYAGLMITADDGHVTTIAVDPAWHRHKIATRLMLVLAGEAIRRGATGLTLEVRVGNHGAQALYRQFGFHPAGIRRNYYVETNEDALVMWADDVDGPEYAQRLARIEAGIPGTTIVEELRTW